MDRINRFREKGIKAALFSSEINMHYLSGYRGEGCLLVLPESVHIITDFRYIEQAERQSPESKIEQTGKDASRSQIVKRLLSECGLTELAVETNVMTHDEFVALEKVLEGITLVSMPHVTEEMREIKTEEEIACIRKAGEISCKAFDDMLAFIKPGMTEKEVCAYLDYRMRVHGSEGCAFDTIVASGANGSLPHAVPSDKVIEKGELVTFDFGAKIGGYCSDMTRTIAIGEISDELHAIYDAVLEAQLKALSYIGPGKSCFEADKVARDLLEEKYPGAFGHSLGHGVGLFIHESPSLSFRSEKTLTKGHVVTVEPGVYIPGVGGCRIEDTIIITDDGFINTITTPKQLIVV
ncbi:MAG: aminopeptidase P family protein [Clostridia bacterium]|nr:aminopeptidase P family protein [Clostridia bacterium]MBQ5770909.1 aminopeptidase P family protein [Clostridia bacterium]